MAQNLSRESKERLQMKLLDAAAWGELSVVKKMAKSLDNGDGIKKIIEITKDKNGLGAFHLAAVNGRTEICHYFIRELGFNPDFRSDQGGTPLFYAAMGGKIDTLIYLCNRGADPTATDEKGKTPLHWAAALGCGESIEFLLSKGVPVDPEYINGTPLHVAAAHGKENAVKILLEHNADFNKNASEMYTPLHMSIQAKSLNCTKLLIKAGADPNLRCPLVSAIVKNSVETVKCLLEAGADPNIPCSRYGKLPIEIAAECGKLGFVEMLLPLTSRLPDLANWTIEGVINYVKSPAFKKKHEIMSKKMYADLKAKGEQAFRRKEYFAAIWYYTEAMETAPSDAVLYANRSICWLHMVEGQRALKDALTAQNLRPNWPKAYYRIGSALMLLKEYEEASQALLDGLKLDPTNNDIEKALLEALDCMKKSDSV